MEVARESKLIDVPEANAQQPSERDVREVANRVNGDLNSLSW